MVGKTIYEVITMTSDKSDHDGGLAKIKNGLSSGSARPMAGMAAALIGFDTVNGALIYARNDILRICETDGMSPGGALEYYNYSAILRLPTRTPRTPIVVCMLGTEDINWDPFSGVAEKHAVIEFEGYESALLSFEDAIVGRHVYRGGTMLASFIKRPESGQGRRRR